MSEWKCVCGAVNVARSCEACGADQPVAAMPAAATKDSTTQELLKRPLCEHVTEAGAMCAACRVSVDRMREQLRRTLGVAITAPANDEHERRKARARGQLERLTTEEQW